MTSDYRKDLVKSINDLIQIRHKLFGETMNLALMRDLREINEAFAVGDTYTFELAHFKNSSDSNVNRLVHLIEEIQDTVDSLINVNKIDDEEINWEGNEDNS